MVNGIKKLSLLEWEIMNIIWAQNKKLAVRDVLAIAYPNGEKAYTTVQTVLNNLETKGYLTKEKIGLVNFYSAIKSQEEIVKKETSSFVKRVYNGSFKALANYLIDSNNLTEDEIADLQFLIKQKELKGKRKP